jgi:hypothetical protein
MVAFGQLDLQLSRVIKLTDGGCMKITSIKLTNSKRFRVVSSGAKGCGVRLQAEGQSVRELCWSYNVRQIRSVGCDKNCDAAR